MIVWKKLKGIDGCYAMFPSGARMEVRRVDDKWAFICESYAPKHTFLKCHTMEEAKHEALEDVQEKIFHTLDPAIKDLDSIDVWLNETPWSEERINGIKAILPKKPSPPKPYFVKEGTTERLCMDLTDSGEHCNLKYNHAGICKHKTSLFEKIISLIKGV